MELVVDRPRVVLQKEARKHLAPKKKTKKKRSKGDGGNKQIGASGCFVGQRGLAARPRDGGRSLRPTPGGERDANPVRRGRPPGGTAVTANQDGPAFSSQEKGGRECAEHGSASWEEKGGRIVSGQ